MNTNETQLINSMLTLAALSANISPEELKEYVNVLSPKENPSKVRSDDRFSDADILRTAVPLVVLRSGSKILLPLRGKGRKENLDEH